MVTNSMMWRATYTVGAVCLSGALGYAAFVLGTDADHEHGLAFRLVTASALALASVWSMVKAFRGMPHDRPVQRARGAQRREVRVLPPQERAP